MLVCAVCRELRTNHNHSSEPQQQPIAFIYIVKTEAEGSSTMLANFYHTTWCQTAEDGNHSDTERRTSNFMKLRQTPQHRCEVYLGITACTRLPLLSAATLWLTLLFNLSHLQILQIVSDTHLETLQGAQQDPCYQPHFYMAGNRVLLIALQGKYI